MQPPLRNVVRPSCSLLPLLLLLTALRSIPEQGQAPIHVR
jgi:hypothetical protein